MVSVEKINHENTIINDGVVIEVEVCIDEDEELLEDKKVKVVDLVINSISDVQVNDLMVDHFIVII